MFLEGRVAFRPRHSLTLVEREQLLLGLKAKALVIDPKGELQPLALLRGPAPPRGPAVLHAPGSLHLELWTRSKAMLDRSHQLEARLCEVGAAVGLRPEAVARKVATEVWPEDRWQEVVRGSARGSPIACRHDDLLGAWTRAVVAAIQEVWGMGPTPQHVGDVLGMAAAAWERLLGPTPLRLWKATQAHQFNTLRRAAEGDCEAWELAYDIVYLHVLNLTPRQFDFATRDDIAAHAADVAIRSLPKLRDGTKLRSYLLRTVRSSCRNKAFRATPRSGIAPDKLGADFDADAFLDTARLHRIARELATPEQWNVWAAVYVEGESVADAARRLQIRRTAADTRLRRLVQKVKRELGVLHAG